MFCDKRNFLLILLFHPFQVLFACTLSVSDGINFGVYNPFSNASTQSTTKLKVNCNDPKSVAFTVTLDPGSSGQYSNRTLISSEFIMNYNVYMDPAHAQVWGDGTSGTGYVNGQSSDCTKGCEYTLYGLVPPNQISVGVGAYTDTVRVTLTF